MLKKIKNELRYLWKQMNCKHTHTFKYSLEGATRIYGNPHGSNQCTKHGLVLEGCYICGKIKVIDRAA
jgi:hypothetical protein